MFEMIGVTLGMYILNTALSYVVEFASIRRRCFPIGSPTSFNYQIPKMANLQPDIVIAKVPSKMRLLSDRDYYCLPFRDCSVRAFA